MRDYHTFSNRGGPIRTGQLLEELRRRKVYRTAAAYLAGVFVVLQAADLTFQPLGLSADVYRALVIVCFVGFPIAITISWFFDLRAEPVEEAEAPATSKQHWGSAAVLAFVLICAGAIGWYGMFRWHRVERSTHLTIAVMPFDVLGGADLAYLHDGIVEMVSRNIDGAGNLRAVAPEAVLSATKKNAQPDALAKELGARYVLSGNIAQAGNTVRITATLQDYDKTDAKPQTLDVSGSADQLLSLVDQLSARVLATTRSGEDAHLSQTAASTTTSLPALRSYLEGEDHFRKAQYDSAIGHFAQSVGLDSTFALAYYRLALAHVAKGEAAAARDPITRAVAMSTRLPERDQRLLRSVAEAFDGKWRAAEADLRELQVSYPADLEVTYSLGSLLAISNPRHGKSVEEPEQLLRKVVDVDRSFLCPI